MLRRKMPPKRGLKGKVAAGQKPVQQRLWGSLKKKPINLPVLMWTALNHAAANQKPVSKTRNRLMYHYCLEGLRRDGVDVSSIEMSVDLKEAA